MTTVERKGKELGEWKAANHHSEYCRKCGKQFQVGDIVVFKAYWYRGVGKGITSCTLHRECFVDAHGEPIYGEMHKVSR